MQLVARVGLSPGVDQLSMGVRIQARYQAGLGRRTHRRGAIGALKQNPLSGKRIQVRRSHQCVSETAKAVRVPLVAEDQDDVRTAFPRGTFFGSVMGLLSFRSVVPRSSSELDHSLSCRTAGLQGVGLLRVLFSLGIWTY